MTNHYESELKQEIICLYLEEGRTIKSLTEESSTKALLDIARCSRI